MDQTPDKCRPSAELIGKDAAASEHDRTSALALPAGLRLADSSRPSERSSTAKLPSVQQLSVGPVSADAAEPAVSDQPLLSEPGQLTLDAVVARAQRLADLMHPFLWDDRPDAGQSQQGPLEPLQIQGNMPHVLACVNGQQQQQQESAGDQPPAASHCKPESEHPQPLNHVPYRTYSVGTLSGAAHATSCTPCNENLASTLECSDSCI